VRGNGEGADKAPQMIIVSAQADTM
jgi:hypothetical protein